MIKPDFDVVICGGGVAGAAAAILLGSAGHQVALVDATTPTKTDPQSDYDLRVVAISPGSAAILTAAGAWPGDHPERLAPYDRMQVLAGRGQVQFSASEHGLEALGWIAEIPLIRESLWNRIRRDGKVHLLAPARIDQVELRRDRNRLVLDDGKTLTTSLLVAADGARSRLRQLAGIKVDEWHYNQSALVAPIATEHANTGLAWQRFTEHGPLALLPLADGRSSIVWSQASERTDRLTGISDDEFIAEINSHQDSPMGPVVSVGKRHGLPLVRRRAQRFVQQRLVLLGDAARTVHPLAGQGLNLGLADAAALAEVMVESSVLEDPSAALDRYQRWRRSASEVVGGGIHAINELAHAPGSLGRGLLGAGFSVAARFWPAREAFVDRACGLDSDSPALARQERTR